MIVRTISLPAVPSPPVIRYNVSQSLHSSRAGVKAGFDRSTRSAENGDWAGKQGSFVLSDWTAATAWMKRGGEEKRKTHKKTKRQEEG